MYFYSYHSKVNSSRTLSNRSNASQKEDYSWLYVGTKNFLMDVYINDKLVQSKYFDLNKN